MLRREIVLASFVLTLSCGAETTTHVSEPIVAEVQIQDTWAPQYAGSPHHPNLNNEQRAFAKEIEQRANLNCKFDGRLFRAARQYAQVIGADSLPPKNEDMDRLRYTVLKTGTADYALRPIVAHFDEAGMNSLVKLIEKNSSSFTHCGFGIAGEVPNRLVVWIGIERIVDLAPFPSRVEPGQRMRLQGQVLSNSRTVVEPFLGHPDRSVTRLPVVHTSQSGRFSIEIQFTKTGRSEIELLVDRGRGPEAAVLAPVFVGVEPDTRPVVSVDDEFENGHTSPKDALLRYLCASRKRLGLQMLKENKKLSEVALAHSKDMVNRGFFGHISPTGGILENRLAKRKLFPSYSAENIARSSSPLRIHRNLMGSPSHRINVLDPKFTDVGIGIVEDKNELIATEVFARF